MPNTGNTSTFAFTPWATFAPSIISIEIPGYTLEALDDNDLTTTGFMQKVPADLQDIEEMTLEVRLPDDSQGRFTNVVADLLVSGVHMDPAVGTVTISFPAGTAGDGTDPTLAATAFVTGFKPNPLNNEDRRTGTITLQFDGKTGPTYAVGAA